MHLFRKRRSWWLGLIGVLGLLLGVVAMARPLPANTSIAMVPERLLVVLWKYGISHELWPSQFFDPVADRLEKPLQDAWNDPNLHAKPRIQRIGQAAVYRIKHESDSFRLHYAMQLAALARVDAQDLEPAMQQHLEAQDETLRSSALHFLESCGFLQSSTALALLSMMKDKTLPVDHRERASRALGRMLGRFPDLIDAYADALDPSVLRYPALLAVSIEASAEPRILKRLLQSSSVPAVDVGLALMGVHSENKRQHYVLVYKIARDRQHPARAGAIECLTHLGPSIDGYLAAGLVAASGDDQLDLITVLRRRGGSAKRVIPVLKQLIESDSTPVLIKQAAKEAIDVIQAAPEPESPTYLSKDEASSESIKSFIDTDD